MFVVSSIAGCGLKYFILCQVFFYIKYFIFVKNTIDYKFKNGKKLNTTNNITKQYNKNFSSGVLFVFYSNLIIIQSF